MLGDRHGNITSSVAQAVCYYLFLAKHKKIVEKKG